MTEGEWLSATDPAAMVTFVRGAATTHKTRWQGWMWAKRFWVSERKWRLLDCAVTRRVAHLVRDAAVRELLTAAEQFAEGLISSEEYGARRRTIDPDMPHTRVAENVILALHLSGPDHLFRHAAAVWCVADDHERPPDPEDDMRQEMARQADLVRCVVGNPFRPPALLAHWLDANDGAARRIARAIYDERRFVDLPILADALEDAGCDDDFVLAHCRDDKLHARGCHAVDAVLGKV